MSAELIFEHPRAQVWCGSWQDLELPPGSVDKVLTDPPYTAHVQSNVRSCSTNGALKVQTYDLNFDPLSSYEHVPQLLDLATRWVVLFCALEQFGDYERAAGGPRKKLEGENAKDFRARRAAYVRSGIWRKQQAAPQLSGDRPANSCEGWAVMHPKGGKLAWNGRGKHAYLSSDTDDENAPFFCVPDFVQEGREAARKRHPAQKPAALCDKLAEWFINPGDVVLDAYCGSGALGLAALGRGATVIFADIDPEWAIHTAERVELVLAP